jgi:hypothetical protein
MVVSYQPPCLPTWIVLVPSQSFPETTFVPLLPSTTPSGIPISVLHSHFSLCSHTRVTLPSANFHRHFVEIITMETWRRNSTTAQEVIAMEDSNFNPSTGKSYSQRYRDILLSRRALPVSAERANFLSNYQQNRAVILTRFVPFSSKHTPSYILHLS